MIIIISLLLTFFLVSILPDASYFYIFWGVIGSCIVAHIICFVAGTYEDIDLKKKNKCILCEGYCDKCVANKYRISKNLPAPRKKLPEQMVFHGLGSYSGMCEVCWKYAKEYYTYDKWWVNDNHAICIPCYDKRGK